MRLSALEIKKKEFQQKMRGADPEEVQAFLDQVSAEVEALVREKKDVEDALATTRERLEHYTSLEQMIEKTLVASQQTAVKIEDQARREAELILRDASLERERRMADARAELERAQRDVFRIRTEFDMTLSRMRSVSSTFASFLDTLEAERKPAISEEGVKPVAPEAVVVAPTPSAPIATVAPAPSAPIVTVAPQEPAVEPTTPIAPPSWEVIAPAPQVVAPVEPVTSQPDSPPWMPTPLPSEQMTWGN